jgi:uncharacterized membrane protein
MLLVLYALLVIVIIGVLIGVGEVAFNRIGFSSVEYGLILLSTLAGSAVNIPVGRVTSSEPLVEADGVRIFGIYYRIPRIVYRQTTVVAVNVGGAVVPVVVSIYLLATHPSLIAGSLVATLVTSVLVHLVARKQKGVGIVTPALVPPIIAAAMAYLVAPASPAVVAYVSGTLGTLIGADLTNLRDIGKLGAPMASIGGAGTMDGVFLTGLTAALLVPVG